MQIQRVSHCMQGAEFRGAIKGLKPCTCGRRSGHYTPTLPRSGASEKKQLNDFDPRGHGKRPLTFIAFCLSFSWSRLL